MNLDRRGAHSVSPIFFFPVDVVAQRGDMWHERVPGAWSHVPCKCCCVLARGESGRSLAGAWRRVSTPAEKITTN